MRECGFVGPRGHTAARAHVLTPRRAAALSILNVSLWLGFAPVARLTAQWFACSVGVSCHPKGAAALCNALGRSV